MNWQAVIGLIGDLYAQILGLQERIRELELELDKARGDV